MTRWLQNVLVSWCSELLGNSNEKTEQHRPFRCPQGQLQGLHHTAGRTASISQHRCCAVNWLDQKAPSVWAPRLLPEPPGCRSNSPPRPWPESAESMIWGKATVSPCAESFSLLQSTVVHFFVLFVSLKLKHEAELKMFFLKHVIS